MVKITQSYSVLGNKTLFKMVYKGMSLRSLVAPPSIISPIGRY